MTSFCYAHPDNEAHDPGPQHPERSARLAAIIQELQSLPKLVRKEAPKTPRDPLTLVHTQKYIDFVFSSVPEKGYRGIEINDTISEYDTGSDTVLSPRSGDAILRSVGGALAAVDDVIHRAADNAFCLTRPPGHHALANKAMGFCAVNNIAIATRYAQKMHKLDRIAIVDFDVHHGNGTQAIFEKDKSVFFASIHQLPLWPESGYAHEIGVGNVLNVPILPNTPREAWLEAWKSNVINRLEKEDFDLLLISAGFDAHRQDPLGSQNLESEDYGTITQDMLDIANQKCEGRTIAMLEGGYDITASAQSAGSMVSALLG